MIVVKTTHLAKQAWRIIYNPESYWVQILKVIYFQNSSIDCKRKVKASWVWSNTIQVRDFLRRNGQWIIAAGEKIQIGTDRSLLNALTMHMTFNLVDDWSGNLGSPSN
ncbi:hypothetical protein VNO77_24899 [Canavalia gladiata]|uniref:Uncharacterized protein n=1 Tax=Canavalia gladiata TaxID=3824 RepID=A0AAN9L8J5_CANGL